MSKNKTSKRVLASTAALCLVLSSTGFTAKAATVAPSLKGNNRVETAIKIAEQSWNNAWKGDTTAILAGGNQANLVDSLAVAPLAYKLEAPILLDDGDKDVVNAETLKALKDNGVKTVYVATGTGVISDKAVKTLEEAGMTVERLGGKDREATAKKIFDKFKELGGNTDTVALVSSNALVDALSVAPIAAKQGMPIVLTGKDALAADFTEVLKAAKKVYAIGGKGVISDAVVDQVKAERLEGHSRYDTNAAVIGAFEKAGNVKFDKVYFANGLEEHLVDALTGSVLAAQSDSAVVLTNNDLDSKDMANTKAMLKEKVTNATEINAFGGAVTDEFLEDVKNVNNAENLEVESVSVVGSKKIAVNFSEPVDTEKAKVALKKGTVAVNTDAVEFAEDKMSATITTTTKITSGDYTVSVSGLTEKPITGTVTAENEKLSKINILSDKAPRVAADAKKALVSYEVLNQYGEKMIGQNITWTVSTGETVVDDHSGKLTITAANSADFVPGAIVYITGVNATSGTVVNGKVEIALASQPDSVSFKGVYDKTKGKLVDLPAGFDDDRYDLLLQVTDQYGNTMDDPDMTKLVFTSNNPLFINSTVFDTEDDVTIDGVTYKAIGLNPSNDASKGGSVVIQAISTITGKTSTYNIQADALSTVKSFTMSAPADLVAEGETVEVPFTAVDQYGNAVTDYASLNSQVTLNPAANIDFVEQNDGTAKLIFTAPSSGAADNVDLPVYLTSVVSDGGSFSSLMINVKVKAVPTAIVGLDSDVTTSVAAGNAKDISATDLIIEDQYGRAMDDATITAWLDEANTSIIVDSDYAAADDTSAFGVAIGAGEDQAQNIMAESANTLKLTTTANTSSTEKLTFTLANSNDATTPIVASAKSITFSNVDKSEYESYEVADLGTMYNNGTTGTADANYNKTVKVYGVKANGTKVLLPAADYTVALDNSKLDASTGVIKEAEESFTADDFTASGDYADVKVNVLVTVNDIDSGSALSILEKELLVSNIAPKVATVTFNSNVADGKAIIHPASADDSISNANLTGFIDAIKDQYGVALAKAPTITVTNLTKVAGSTFLVTDNGKATASIANAAQGDKFTVTYKFASGVSAKVDFTVGLTE